MHTCLNRFKLMMVFLATALMISSLPVLAAHHESSAAPTQYVCGCGASCDCGTIADQPGKCACGKPLIEKKVLKEDDKAVYTCACPEGCNCDIDPADASKCACGKTLKAYPKAEQRADCPVHEKKAMKAACNCCNHGSQKVN